MADDVLPTEPASDPLSPAETAQLRELLRRHNAQNAVVKFVTNLPGLGRLIGKVGPYVVVLLGLNTTLDVLLIPQKAESVYEYYKPTVQTVYDQLASTLDEFRRNPIDPDSLPPTNKYIVFDPLVPITTTTTTAPEPSGNLGVTIIASTGVSPQIVAGSSVISRSTLLS